MLGGTGDLARLLAKTKVAKNGGLRIPFPLLLYVDFPDAQWGRCIYLDLPSIYYPNVGK